MSSIFSSFYNVFVYIIQRDTVKGRKNGGHFVKDILDCYRTNYFSFSFIDRTKNLIIARQNERHHCFHFYMPNHQTKYFNPLNESFI